MNHSFTKRISLQNISNYKEFFDNFSVKVKDPFGIECLILTPLRRILKYHLIFESFQKALSSSEEISSKNVKLCNAVIKQFKKVYNLINAAEEINSIENFIFVSKNLNN